MQRTEQKQQSATQINLEKLDDCLLQECDFSEAIKLARDQTVHREGAYEFDANRTLHKHADSLWWKFYLTEQQKMESLREKALEMKGYHPIPEIKPWPGQFHFMNLLRYLESKCRNHCTNQSEIFSTARLKLQGDDIRIPTAGFPKLPLSGTDNNSIIYMSAYGITLTEFKEPRNPDDLFFDRYFKRSRTDGLITATLVWDSYFLTYMSKYNILPSKDFLITLQKIVKQCQKSYRDELKMAIDSTAKKAEDSSIIKEAKAYLAADVIYREHKEEKASQIIDDRVVTAPKMRM